MTQLFPRLKSLPQPHTDSATWRDGIQLVATDMDGTLTEAGRFTPALLDAFRQLKRRGIQVLVVTGRSAGWVGGLVNYLEVAGAIAENGGIYYPSAGETAGDLLVNISDIEAHRQQLHSVFTRLKEDFPQLQSATDNRFRLTDWTFTNTGFSGADLFHIQQLCSQLGWGFTYSSIQCHIKPPRQTKGSALLTIARQLIPGITSEKVVTVGDSPNDESLFVRDDYPYSVGVANIIDFSDRLQHQPAYVTRAREGEGFCELVEWLLTS